MHSDMLPMGIPNQGNVETLLPPGYRFHPTDEELISYYLTNKVTDNRFTVSAIGEVDLNKCEPWDLPEKAKMGEKEWYFFSLRDRKYPTGLRTNRATDAGYWKATGKDREVMSSRRRGCLVGMKKTLVFYKGRAPKGAKTNWIMHEYRMEGDSPTLQISKATKDEWVVCRIFRKNIGAKKCMVESSSSHGETDTQASLPPLLDSPNRAFTEEGGTDSEFNGVHRDLSPANSQAARESNDLKNICVSEGGDLTTTAFFAAITPQLGCISEDLRADSSRQPELQQQSILPSSTTPPFPSFAPFQASSLPPSTLVLKALLEQYSISGTHCKMEAREAATTPRSIKNPILNTWSMDWHPQYRGPTFTNQLEIPVHHANNQPPFLSIFSEVCEDVQHASAYSGFTRYPTEQTPNNTDLESLWTY
eukprot:c21687_g2_i1 orf=210-1466(-)